MATTEIYTYGHTLSLHDALPIWPSSVFALQRRRQPRTLIDRALGIELGGDIGAADDVDVCAAGTQRLGELAQRFLAGAEHDGVDFQQRRLLALVAVADQQIGRAHV